MLCGMNLLVKEVGCGCSLMGEFRFDVCRLLTQFTASPLEMEPIYRKPKKPNPTLTNGAVTLAKRNIDLCPT